MKILVASDIHGSALYCSQLLAQAENEKPDQILLLGDVLYHGPRNDLPDGYAPKEVISMLNPLKEKIVCVRGNCDAEVDQMVLDFSIRADYTVLNLDGKLIFATHGHIFGEDDPPKMPDDSILLGGHTHVSKCEAHKGFVYANPGSVSIPKENTPRGFMIIEKGEMIWKTLDGEEYRRVKM